MRSSNEKMLDVKDFLVEILFRWKPIVIFTLVVALLFTGFGVVQNRSGNIVSEEEGGEFPEQDIEERKEKQIEEAREALTDVEAQDVERVFRQYQSYIEYRNLYQEELESFDQVFDRSDHEMMIKSVNYSVESTMEGADICISGSALDIEDYHKIAEILPETESLQAAYKRVFFTSLKRDSKAVTGLAEESAILSERYIIHVEIPGESREICEGIWEIVDAAVRREKENLRKADPDIKLEIIDSNYQGNINQFYTKKKQEALDTMQRVDSMINNLKLYSIDKFTEEQAAYFNALRNPERGLIEKGILTKEQLTGEETAEAKTGSARSLLKYGVLGVLAGLFVSFLFVLLRYLLRGTINVGKEMQKYYCVPVLSTFFLQGERGSGIFSGLIRRMLHADSSETGTKAAMIAADTCGAVQASGGDSVYIAQTCDSVVDVKIANMMEQAVRNQNQKYIVSTGLPLGSVEEMQALTQQKNVLLLVHHKKTLQADVEKLLDLCGRHAINVLGTVGITDI